MQDYPTPHSIYSCNNVTIPMELERGYVRGRLMFTYSFPEFRDIVVEHYERGLQDWADVNDETPDDTRASMMRWWEEYGSGGRLRFTRAQVYDWSLGEMMDWMDDYYEPKTEIFHSQAEEDAFNGHEADERGYYFEGVRSVNICNRSYADIRAEIIDGHLRSVQTQM
jgi:hypothetical protein